MAAGLPSSPAQWRQLLLAALESNSHLQHTRFFQLATVGSNGWPANRTVVFRGLLEGCDKFQINTDSRSHKIEEIKHRPFGEICWYFTDSWEQFRINGTIDVIDGSNDDPIKLQQREKAWFTSSLKSRFQYLGNAPGLPFVYEETVKGNYLDPSIGPVEAFCLLLLDPEKVDYLNLKSSKRLLFTLARDVDGRKSWASENINP